MGDGKNLKKILDEQEKSVRWLAKETTISPTTLYSIIQKDTAIRFDFALRIANVLNVEVSDICSDSALKAENWSDESKIILPELPHGFDKVLDGNYQLTDEGRRDVDSFIEAQLQIKKDPKRAADVKKITRW